MMWYGRRNFLQKDETLDRGALLLTLALAQDPEALDLWSAVYTVTSFFAGASDDNGYYEYRALLDQAYGGVPRVQDLAAEALDLWSAVYTVTSFFAGASDDNGYYEYRALLDQAYGGVPRVQDLAENTAAWDVYHELTAELPAPRINSIPVVDVGTEADHLDEGRGFRLMGQRFSLDESIFTRLTYNRVGENPEGGKRLLPNGLDVPAAFGSDAALGLLEVSLDESIFTRLTYNRVGENPEGGKRLLPNGLDVPAAFGSDAALGLLEDMGATAYAGYPEHLEALRAEVAEAPAETWLTSLYSQWLLMLRPLTAAHGEGYPPFMQSDAWARKDLQSFLGSYAELKHDTILYAKQMMAEGGGGGLDPRDDRGYVEPEPELFARLASLVEATIAGLSGYGLLGEADAQNLGILRELAARLEAIARKELVNELPTDEEFELIRSFGVQIEHFWQEVHKNDVAEGEYLTTFEFPSAIVADVASDPNGQVIRSFGVQIEHFWQEVHKNDVAEGEYLTTFEFPSAIVADVASDPNGQVLEVGTGEVSTIYAVVPVDGVLRLASGSVYSYYEFPWPMSDRLTDSAWLRLLGMDNMDRETFGTPQVAPVSWTDDFSLCWRDFY